MKSILVIAAHPDDEALGASGTLARHAQDGDKVHIIFLADGESSRGSTNNLDKRQSAAHNCAKIIGAQEPHFLTFTDNKMDSYAILDIVQAIEPLINDIQPNIIYTHHGGDLNIDHNITHRAVLTACRPMEGSNLETIYGFEVLSSTEWASPDQDKPFSPCHYVDISEFYETKIKALKCYNDEMRAYPHARSYEVVESLAKLRGSQAGLQKAEAFTILQSFWRK